MVADLERRLSRSVYVARPRTRCNPRGGRMGRNGCPPARRVHEGTVEHRLPCQCMHRRRSREDAVEIEQASANPARQPQPACRPSAPASAWSSPAATCSTASGCDGRTGGSTRACSCGPPTRCSLRWGGSVRRPRPPRAAGHGRDRAQSHAGDARRPHAQEAQIARLARDGLSNPKSPPACSSVRSPRTVQYHLRKVFMKLGISSRSQLDRVLPSDPTPVGPR